MDAVFDLQSEPLRQSLAETIAWCASQKHTVADESDDVRARRLLVSQGVDLMDRARLDNRFWDRLRRKDYTHSALWKQGMALVRGADLGSLIPPLRQNLRSNVLSAAQALAEQLTNDEREGIPTQPSQKTHLRKSILEKNIYGIP